MRLAAVAIVAVIVVAVVAVGAGCPADRTLPGDVGARTPCTKTDECPPDHVCPVVEGGASAFCLPTKAAACGNAVLDLDGKDGAEECDDGNFIAGDGCRADCTREACGDGVVDVAAGEVCDGTPDCNDRCAPIACGDGFLDDNEECDDGADNDDAGDAGACRTSCTVIACGDQVVDVGAGEVCDDDNTVSGDGCSGDCHKVERCGDGVVDTGEACDDASNGGTGDADCYADCTKRVTCGDGVVDLPGVAGAEVCDDATLGGTNDGDCRSDCRKRNACGDGALDSGEACDDANDNDNDGCAACRVTTWDVDVLTGLGVGGGDPLALDLFDPLVAVDRLGRVFFCDGETRVFRMDSFDAHAAVVVAGTGSAGFSGDGGPATGARLLAPRGMSVDNAGRVFISDAGNLRVRRVDVDGTIHTVAGTGIRGNAVSGIPALLADIGSPFDAEVDSRGQVYISDLDNCALRRVDAAGFIDTIKGGDCNAPPEEQAFAFDLDVDDQDRVLIGDARNGVVLRFDGTSFETIAGGGPDFVIPDGSDPLNARIGNPRGVTADGDRVFIAAVNRARIFVVENGTIRTVAGTGVGGFSGDGGPAVDAQVDFPSRVAIDPDGRILSAEIGDHRVRVIDNGVINTIAGAPPRAELDRPRVNGVAVDRQGRLLFNDANTFIARVEADGTSTLLVGNGAGASFDGDGKPGPLTGISRPNSLLVDAQDRIWFCDTAHGRIRRLEQDGTVSTVFGDGGQQAAADGEDATTSSIGHPLAMAFDPSGELWFSDELGATLRRIDAQNHLVTLIGDGNFGFVDNVTGAAAELSTVPSLVVLPNGDVVFADPDNHCVRKWSAAADLVTTIVGTGGVGPAPPPAPQFVGEGGLATAAIMSHPQGIAFDGAGRLFVADDFASRVLRVDVDGTIHTVAGLGTNTMNGDGGPASAAGTASPLFLATLGAFTGNDDDFAFADAGDVVRAAALRVVRDGIVTTVAGVVTPGGTGALATGTLSSPAAFAAIDANTLLLAGGTSGFIERVSLDPQGDGIDVVAGYPEGFAVGADPAPVSTPDGPEARASLFALFKDACGIAWDPVRSFAYVADRGVGVVYRLRVDLAAPSSSFTLAVVAGAPGDLLHRDGLTAGEGRLVSPCGLAIDDAPGGVGGGGQLVIADVDDDTVRLLDVESGALTTLFGVPGAPGNLADLLSGPSAVVVDAGDVGDETDDALFISDTNNHRVRRLELVRDVATGAIVGRGAVVDVLGTGEPASSGDGTPSRAFPVDAPRGLALDDGGNLFVTSTRTLRVVTPASDTGVVDGGGAVLTIYGELPRDTFPQDSTFCLGDVDLAADDDIRVVDSCQGYLLALHRRALP